MAASDLSLGGTLKSRIEKRGGATWIALDGTLNEACNLAPLTQIAGPIVIDLAGLSRINSVGVRNWMDFVRSREAAGVDLTFERCSPSMVSQMSMITKFMGSRSRVKSVHVPYVCGSCKTEHLHVLDVAPGTEVPARMACPKCGSAMEVDDLLETYSEALRTL
jgi:hypothetical protein